MICPRCHETSNEQWCGNCGWPRRSTGGLRVTGPLPMTYQTSEYVETLRAGTLLRGGYRLFERQSRQSWLSGAYEATWLAEDLGRRGEAVRICEVMLPEKQSIARNSLLHTAAGALLVAGRHAHLPALLDVFEDRGRGFFVFERVEGESLLARMRRIRRVLSEQEVIDCCLQMIGVLEFLAMQSVPIVHGLIQPENVLVGRISGHYMLANGSIILAARAAQYVNDVPRGQLSPYTAPEFGRGPLNVRADIYSLIATAYFLITGRPPVKQGGMIPPASHYTPIISPQLEAILERGLFSGLGLRPNTALRYHHPSELRWDLLATCVMEAAI